MSSAVDTDPRRESRTTTDVKKASLYRMYTDDHICPFGLKSRWLLTRKGYEVEDHLLESREETEAFKSKEGVETTPQTYIDGERVGGYDALRTHFGLDAAQGEDDTTYQPVVAIFGMALAIAIALTWATHGELFEIQTLLWFIPLAMCLLALQKLRDVEAFTNQFLGYDLLAQKFVPYAYVYPWAEALAGVLMLAGAALWLAVPVALVIGTIGAVSVFKAVYLDKRELHCACVGGESTVPLGFVSLTENLMMVGMAVWMLVRAV